MAGGTAVEPAPEGWLRALAAVSEDPQSDLLALVWGPSFDRVHALALLARLPRPDGAWVHALHAFGERYDALPPAGQRLLRQRILRMADNAACPASC